MLLMVWFCSFLPFHKLHGKFFEARGAIPLEAEKAPPATGAGAESTVIGGHGKKKKLIRQIIQSDRKGAAAKRLATEIQLLISSG